MTVDSCPAPPTPSSHPAPHLGKPISPGSPSLGVGGKFGPQSNQETRAPDPLPNHYQTPFCPSHFIPFWCPSDVCLDLRTQFGAKGLSKVMQQQQKKRSLSHEPQLPGAFCICFVCTTSRKSSFGKLRGMQMATVSFYQVIFTTSGCSLMIRGFR